MSMTFTIAEDSRPGWRHVGHANPVTAYRAYLRDGQGGTVGDMGFTVDDFKTYIAGMRKPDWKKIFATVIDDHHEIFVRLADDDFVSHRNKSSGESLLFKPMIFSVNGNSFDSVL
jgi:hypothetical protein